VSGPAPDEPVEVLRRWEASGALWRVVSRTPTHLEIALVTCTGDEEVDRWSSGDPTLRAFVGDRAGSDAPPA
jgi:hypothetical protein